MNKLYTLPDNINYTDEQKDAIFQEGNNILVSAAAGCGKTTLMVERIIRKVLQDQIDINTLVVVTFTEAAANELKERLEKALQQRLKQMPEQQLFLKRQIALLNESYIMTFHSLCFQLLQENNLKFNFDENIKISSGFELDSAKLKAYHQFFEIHCLEEDFIILDEYYNANLTNKDKLYDTFKRIIEIAHNNGGFDSFNEIASVQPQAIADMPIFATLLQDYLTYYTQAIINDFKTIMIIESNQIVHEQVNKNIAIFDELQNLVDNFDFNKIVSYISNIKLVARPKKSYNTDEAIAIYEALNDSWKTNLKKVFAEDEDTILKIYHCMNSHAQLLLKYAQLFDEYFQAFKVKRGLLEFGDLETYTLSLLYNQDNTYSDTALQLQTYFNEIMIDEYQDTSNIQEKIVKGLSNNNQFMVGDVKQSIYRFRNATSAIFTNKYLDYSHSQNGDIINLSTNFRSREEVLAFTNFIFKNIFSQSIGGLDYDDQAALHFGNTKLLEYNGDFKSELLVNIKETKEPKGSKDIISNSKMIIKKIDELIKDGAHFKDIAILYRNRTNIKFLEQALSSYKIPYMNHGGSGFYKIDQIKELINFLNVLVDQNDEVSLLSILKSYFFNLNDEDILSLRLDNNTLIMSLKSLYPEIYKTIMELRQLAHQLNIISLIDQIYALTSYEEYMQSKVNYQNFVTNLNAFKDIILNNYDYFNSLDYFVLELNKNIKNGFDEATPAVISSKQDVVNIMSIHKAKGLEFKYVFVVCDTAIDIRTGGIEHIDNQLIIDYFNEINQTKDTNHIFKKLYKFNELTHNMAEELRILYVALTRAQLKLFLVFNITQPKLELLSNKIAEKQDWQLNRYLVLGAKSYSELILLALLRHQDHKALLTGYNLNAHEDILTYHSNLYKVTKFSESNEVINEKIEAIYDQKTTIKKIDTFKMIKPSSYKLKPSLHSTDHLLDFNALAKPDSYLQGNNTHKVLELLNFKSNTLIDDIERLAKQYQLDPENKDGIIHLIQDDFFKKIISNQYYQEYNFTTYVDNHLTTGVIDLLVEDNENLYVIDYKSDRLSNEALLNQYQKQLKVYQKALANYSDKAVKLYLYSIKNKAFLKI